VKHDRYIPVFDGCGNVAFRIHVPTGICVHAKKHRSIDPLKIEFDYWDGGDKLLSEIFSIRGLCGETITHYDVDGGDVVRRVDARCADYQDNPLLRFGMGLTWWDKRAARYEHSRQLLQQEFDRRFPEHSF